MDNYAKAEPLLRWALAIEKRALGEKHPSYAKILSNLGLLYHHMGDYSNAEPLLQHALEFEKRALGENHARLCRKPVATWPGCTGPWGTTRRPSHCSAKPWRSPSGRWGRITPTTPTD